MGIDVLCAPQRSPLHIRHRSSCRSTGGLSWRGCHPANFTAAGWSLIMFVVSSSPEKLTGVFGNDKTMFKCQWVECGLEMNKESIGRHVTEAHLSYSYVPWHLLQGKYYPCGWAVLDNVCGVLVPGESLSVHPREAHVIGTVQFAGVPLHKMYYRCGWVALDNVCGVLVPENRSLCTPEKLMS
ncbi:hypothetical protein EDD15DRAFT_2201284 [Pisolithus albus]|nr:hypothetical protein EDD15DRAFT_2201284 [Pisolithus albus]